MQALEYLKKVKKEEFRKEAQGAGRALLFGTGALGINLLLSYFGENELLFGLSLVAVALSCFYSRIYFGIIIVGVSVTAALFLQPNISLLPVAFFIMEGFGLCLIIDKLKRADLVLEYKKREKEYVKLLIKLQGENDKAREEIKARDEFLSIASHELKTPLTTMLSQTQVALHSIRNVSLANFSVENLLKLLESAENQTKRLSKMINDLLNVSLITTGRMELEKEEMELSSTVKEVVERFASKIEKENLEVKVEADKEIKGEWDKLRLEQVVTNLVTNAIKYGDAKPIDISVSNSGGLAKISVKDRGIGIPKEMQKRIFARFGRAVNSKAFEGLGVGLYITNQIVTAHGGKILIESEEGKGSTFLVELPLKNPPKNYVLSGR